ncbi:MAG: sigma-70 family RNA polymerase sigma factor [Chloroflexota bacterium]|nr:sigma-70 family RNA polymerase sigma factor [Chloroflexota bacterium]
MDRTEWQVVYEELFPRVFRALVAIGARPDEAEDALHDAFEQALSRREHVIRPEGWLFVVASRRWRRHRIRSAIFHPLSALTRAPEPDWARSELLTEMRRLPLRQRQVLAARYLIGLSQDETATALGIARGTVGPHTTQGLANLRKRLEPR